MSWRSSYLNNPRGSDTSNDWDKVRVLDLKLQQLVKKTIKKCCGCKRFLVDHYTEQSAGLFPEKRTTQNLPFNIIGVDYAGPLLCKTKGGKETKV